MIKYIPRLIAGLTALTLFTGCGNILHMAGRSKSSGTENAPSYKEFQIQSIIGEEPKEDELKRAIWFFQKGDLYLASAKTEEFSESVRKANLNEAAGAYEKGLELISDDIKEFYKNPYNGFRNKGLSADLLTGVFEKSFEIYRNNGNSARAAFAIHHLDWISWNRQKMELHRNGLSIDSIERMEKEGLLADLTISKYYSIEDRRKEIVKGKGTGDFDNVLREARNRREVSSRFKFFSASQEESDKGDKILLVKLSSTELSYEDRREQVSRLNEQRRIERLIENKESETNLAFGDVDGRQYPVKVGN